MDMSVFWLMSGAVKREISVGNDIEDSSFIMHRSMGNFEYDHKPERSG